jgi:hypothetical protein
MVQSMVRAERAGKLVGWGMIERSDGARSD